MDALKPNSVVVVVVGGRGRGRSVLLYCVIFIINALNSAMANYKTSVNPTQIT
jgi:ABC-type transporter Mla maintaining outer membrane lipid asymmetry ATPase subunit MlaF